MGGCPSCGAANVGSAKFCPECGTPLPAVDSAEVRKIVTVVFCDVVGSTSLGESLDPEMLRTTLARFFERMKSIVAAHGGTVEKFIGDAVMAVFGLPVAHEDDALRALRAAVEMRESFPALGLEGRIGVNSGEVVAGTAERLATGDAVNVAARLQQLAEPGEIFCADTTLQMTRVAVEAEPMEPLSVKGRSEPVAAWRVRAVTPHVPEPRPSDSPLVGRSRELIVLREAWQRARGESRCELVTLLGAAGVGKSRLVAEFTNEIGATGLYGRCLSYGEGITYWPVVEVLKQLDTRRASLPVDAATSRTLDALLSGSGATSTDEIARAFRKVIEALAADEPVVVVFDDIQWAEATFLDLIEHVALVSTGVPILLICMARPELLERRGDWGGVHRLEPLAQDAAAEILEHRVGHGLDASVRERILAAAAGNPLFVEEMAAMIGDAGDSEVAVPPTLQALIAARLDQLERAERAVLEHGAVEGEVFHRATVQVLTPAEQRLMARLTALVRREFIRPEQGQLSDDDAFRFRHLLVRDAAYQSTPKARRAELHERLADFIVEHAAELPEHDELAGYHYEQAFRYRVDLGLPDESALAARARRHLSAAESTAITRRDFGAALKLTERALALVPPDEIDASLEIDHVDSLAFTGHLADGFAVLEAALERAMTLENRVAELSLRLEHAFFDSFTNPIGSFERVSALVDQALPELEAAGDDLGLYMGYLSAGYVAVNLGRADEQREFLERALVHARRLSAPHHESWVFGFLMGAVLQGSMPLRDIVRWFDEEIPETLRTRYFLPLATVRAMLGEFDAAQDIVATTRALMLESGSLWEVASADDRGGVIALMSGDAAAAEQQLAAACDYYESQGDRGVLSTSAAMRANALYELGRLDEAESWARKAAELADPNDVFTQIPQRCALMKVLARRGSEAEALQLMAEAIERADAIDMPVMRGDTFVDQAEALSLLGHDAQARAALQRGIDCYELKGAIALVERAKSRLSRLVAAPT